MNPCLFQTLLGNSFTQGEPGECRKVLGLSVLQSSGAQGVPAPFLGKRQTSTEGIAPKFQNSFSQHRCHFREWVSGMTEDVLLYMYLKTLRKLHRAGTCYVYASKIAGMSLCDIPTEALFSPLLQAFDSIHLIIQRIQGFQVSLSVRKCQQSWSQDQKFCSNFEKDSFRKLLTSSITFPRRINEILGTKVNIFHSIGKSSHCRARFLDCI